VSDSVDPFCSSSDWVLPAARGLLPGREPWVRGTEHGYLAFTRAVHEAQPMLEPLEAMWGLGCPVIGADASALASELAAECRRAAGRDLVIVCGLIAGSPRFLAVARALDRGYRLGLGLETRRAVASLDGGLDGFLGRRSANFRRGLVRARRRARERGIEFVRASAEAGGAAGLYDRLLAVEKESWKSHEGVGITASSMVDFYRHMVPRLHARGALRLIFARADGRDIAYILGGVRGRRYRGLQFSYAAGFDDCALGNLCQIEQIADLAGEGVTTYDLGVDADYKKRWAEQVFVTVTLVARPR
jgi:CelD/BcsL family acetyltransferase involved in cellulose biosynthesis